MLAYMVVCLAAAVGAYGVAVTAAEESCWASILTENEACAAEQIGCMHATSLGFPSYPLTESMLKRATPYTGDTTRLHQVFTRARKRGVLKVAALGGSVTFGDHCVMPDGREYQECSWVERLKEWLTMRLPSIDITVRNHGQRACGSLCQIVHLFATLPDEDAIDLVIVDVGSNDGKSVERAGHGKSDKARDKLSTAVEVLVRHVLSHPSTPALVFLEAVRYNGHQWRGEIDRPLWGVQDWHRAVLEAYEVPIVSYRDAVWPVYESPPANLKDVLWEAPHDGTHPGWRSQQLYADVLVHYLESHMALECDARMRGMAGVPPLANEETVAAEAAAAVAAARLAPGAPPLLPETLSLTRQVCDGHEPSSYFSSEHGSAGGAQAFYPQPDGGSGGGGSSGGSAVWRLYKDRPKKPGVIGLGAGAAGSVMTFDMVCEDSWAPLLASGAGAAAGAGNRSSSPSPSPALLLTYLTSYESVGVVSVVGHVLGPAGSVSAGADVNIVGSGGDNGRGDAKLEFHSLVTAHGRGATAAAAAAAAAASAGDTHVLIDALDTRFQESPYEVLFVELPAPPREAEAAAGSGSGLRSDGSGGGVDVAGPRRWQYRVFMELLGPEDGAFISDYFERRREGEEECAGGQWQGLQAEVRGDWKFKVVSMSCC